MKIIIEKYPHLNSKKPKEHSIGFRLEGSERERKEIAFLKMWVETARDRERQRRVSRLDGERRKRKI